MRVSLAATGLAKGGGHTYEAQEVSGTVGLGVLHPRSHGIPHLHAGELRICWNAQQTSKHCRDSA